MATKFADVRPGMYFIRDFSVTTTSAALVISKSENYIETFHVYQAANDLRWFVHKWEKRVWENTWMANKKPIKPDYKLILRNIWGRHF